jgi:hypothetical protein
MDTTFETQLNGGVWTRASVVESPEVMLTDWAVFELQLPGNTGRTRHFSGYNNKDREGLASSAIVEFDPATWRGVSESGCIYGLRGMPGITVDCEQMWQSWLALNNVVDAVNVTNELLVAISVPK